jgi:hypothetical protein
MNVNRNGGSGVVWRATLFIIIVCFINIVSSAESQGTVCLGKNLAKSLSEHSDRLYLKIDDSQKIRFERPYSGPTVVIDNLDLSSDHMVYVYFDDKVVQSWKLDFNKLKTESVLIWRASGSWRMEPYQATSCRQKLE